MSELTIRIESLGALKSKVALAAKLALSGQATEATPTLNFVDYATMHKVLSPLRLDVIKAMTGQGSLAIREVARRVNRDIQAVHRDITTLINAGVINRTDTGVEFPYDGLHFDFNVPLAA